MSLTTSGYCHQHMATGKNIFFSPAAGAAGGARRRGPGPGGVGLAVTGRLRNGAVPFLEVPTAATAFRI